MTTIPDRFRHDCLACDGMCCVAMGFEASDQFAITKPKGTPCPNLNANGMCGIHETLPERGFAGCVAWTCYGAGQRISALYKGRPWRDDPVLAAEMFDRMMLLRRLHEVIVRLLERQPPDAAGRLPPAARAVARLADDPAALPRMDDPAAGDMLVRRLLDGLAADPGRR